jgi:hypothetical protein
MVNESGAVSGMIIGKGKRSTLRMPAPMEFLPIKFTHVLAWDQTRGGAV